jgi:uncharacterized protein
MTDPSPGPVRPSRTGPQRGTGRMLLRSLLLAISLALVAGCASTVRVSDAPTSRQPAQPEQWRAAAELARQHAGLSGQARVDNARRIDQLLAGLDDATLAREAAALPPGDPLYAFAGRALISRGLALPRPFDTGGIWSLDTRAPAESDGYRPPERLAMLLPLSGESARAAAPVRDGFLAGYYGENRRRPQVSFYDTTAAGPVAAYQRAVAEGNDFVVGPLNREDVAAVFRSGQLQVPMLALNRAQDAPPAGHASFSLSPEDEGIAAAEYILQRGQRRALMLVGSDDSLRRSANAFRRHFEERGGSIAATLAVGEDPTALAPQLQAAAAPPATPESPGPVDAIFMAVRGDRAHGLVPQLSMAGLAGRLQVATSQLTTGTGNPTNDRLLDGIVFPSETWSVRGLAGLPSAEALAARLPTARGGAARLFAFGYDAWLLTAYPELAAGAREGRLRGATGILSIDAIGNVLRMPTWSTFRNGQPVPLADAGG